MTQAPLIVVGAGHATGEFVTALRQQGYEGRIVVIGEEPHLPYQRPPLSKAYLSGEATVESLYLKQRATYEKAQVEFELGLRVTQIDRAARCIVLSDGRRLEYSKLAINTGGRVRRLAVEGAAQAEPLQNFHYIRTIEDIDKLRRHMERGLRLVIIGGGYIGLEVAAVAVKRGLKVTVLEAMPRLLARVAGPAVSEFYERIHREAGVDVRTGVAVSGFQFDASGDAVSGVVCGDKGVLPADVVIVGVGLMPNIELAEQAGLKVDGGIVVDEFARTSDPDIVAAGDCTNFPSALYGRRMRLESVPNAVEQARTAAATLCGKQLAYNAVPWFWSDQYDVKLQTVGLSQGYDQVVLRGSSQDRTFAAFYLKEGRIIAADVVSRPGEFMVAKRLVGAGACIDPARLADESQPLKALLPQK